MHAYFETEISLHQYAHEGKNEGRYYLRFTPVLKAILHCTGELKFCSYEAWLDEPEEHDRQKEKALSNAKRALQVITEGLTK